MEFRRTWKLTHFPLGRTRSLKLGQTYELFRIFGAQTSPPLVRHLRRRLLRDRTRSHDTKRTGHPMELRRVVRVSFSARLTSGATTVRPTHRGEFSPPQCLHTRRGTMGARRRFTRRHPQDSSHRRRDVRPRGEPHGGSSDLPTHCYSKVTARPFLRPIARQKCTRFRKPQS